MRIAGALARTVLLAAALGAGTATAWARVHVDADIPCASLAAAVVCATGGALAVHRIKNWICVR